MKSEQTSEGDLKTLIVADSAECARLRELISQVVVDHEVSVIRHEETFDACNNNLYQIIWMKMTVPANQEVLSLSTSIRYASKSNRGTVILGLADTQPDVDLRLHGIDEVLVGPLTRSVVRQKYLKWTSVQTIQQGDEQPSMLMADCSKTSTPSPACSENIASTEIGASPDMGLPVDSEARTQTSTAANTDIGNMAESATPTSKSESPTTGTVLSSLRNFNLQSVNFQPRSSRNTMTQAADHTTKEKLRRERIKDSCDQLRVLLPYIRGRKTDMASILEMTVDYLKIINAAIPQDFQNQVINLMSKGAVLPKAKGEDRRRSGRREPEPPESPSATRVSSTVDTGNRVEPGNMVTGPSMYPVAGTKREATESYKPGAKRLHHSPHPIPSPNPAQTVSYIQSETDPNEICRDTTSPLHIQGVHLQPHMYGDLDGNANRRYATNTFLAPDTYAMTTPVSGNTTRMSNLERDAYGMYVENFYQYYSGQQAAQGYGANSLSDYVNPNAVLPVTYSTRMVGNRKYDEQERFPAVPGSEPM